MSAVLTDLNSRASARVLPLDPAQLAHRVPAAFADRPAAKTSSKYVFLSTKTLIDGLFEAGFVAVAATQTHSRRGSDPAYARHMLRFQHPRESVTSYSWVAEAGLNSSMVENMPMTAQLMVD